MEERGLKELREGFGITEEKEAPKQHFWSIGKKREAEKMKESKLAGEAARMENTCLKEKIEEDRRQIETLRVQMLKKDQEIYMLKEALAKAKYDAWSELNLAYKGIGFRIEKLKTAMETTGEICNELEETLRKQAEAIASKDPQ